MARAMTECSTRWIASEARDHRWFVSSASSCTRVGVRSSATCRAATRRETKPAPPLAIGQEQAGLTLDDVIGKQPELVGREGV